MPEKGQPKFESQSGQMRTVTERMSFLVSLFSWGGQYFQCVLLCVFVIIEKDFPRYVRRRQDSKTGNSLGTHRDVLVV